MKIFRDNSGLTGRRAGVKNEESLPGNGGLTECRAIVWKEKAFMEILVLLYDELGLEMKSISWKVV